MAGKAGDGDFSWSEFDPDKRGPTKTERLLDARRKRFRVAVGVVAAALALYFLLRPGDTDDARVRAVLDAIEEAVEEREVGDTLEHIAERYRDAEGLDRSTLKLLLVREFMSRRGVSVQRLGRTEVDIRPDRTAIARFRAALSEGPLEGLAGAGTWDFEVTLAEESGAWLVTSHRRSRER